MRKKIVCTFSISLKIMRDALFVFPCGINGEKKKKLLFRELFEHQTIKSGGVE